MIASRQYHHTGQIMRFRALYLGNGKIRILYGASEQGSRSSEMSSRIGRKKEKRLWVP